MRQFITFVIFCLFAIIPGGLQAHAERISEQQALAVAQSFFNKKNIKAAPQLAMKASGKKNMLADAQAPLYVFNSGTADKGWVVVAGDSRVSPVLAYSNEGYFNPTNLPPAMQAILDDYANQIENLTNQAEPYNSQVIEGYSILPLLTTKWGQHWPYNLTCPKINGQYPVTGCTATAIAQVMYFHRYASMTQSIPSYYVDPITYNALSPVSFNWGAMRNTYSEDDTSITPTSTFAVATLMQYCGYAMQMEYGIGASGAHVSPNAIALYFGYDPSVTAEVRIDHTRREWHQMIFDELSQRRPVILSGHNYVNDAGHTFVCDGYDEGFFHINWGWDGDNDGYFLIDLLSYGGRNQNPGYIDHLKATIGLKPSTGSSSQDGSNLTLSILTDQYNPQITIIKGTRSSKQEDYTIKALAYCYNQTVINNYFDLGWEVSFWGIMPTYYIHSSNVLMQNDVDYKMETTINFGAGIGSGLYSIFPVCRLHGTTQWHHLINSGQNYAGLISTVDNTLNVSHLSTVFMNERLEIKEAELLGIRKVGRKNDAHITFESIPANFPILYLFANNELLGVTSLYDEETKDAHIYFTPKTAGSNQIRITTSPSGSNAIYQSTVNIAAATPASLNPYTHIPNLVNGVIRATQAKIYTDVVNRRSTTFDDAIYYLIEKQMPDMSFRTIDLREEKIYVPGNETKLLTFILNDLEDGSTYSIKTYYYNNNAIQNCGTLTFKMDISGAYDVNRDKSVNAADVTAVYNYIINGNTTFLSSSDVNGDGAVNAADVTAIYKKILGN